MTNWIEYLRTENGRHYHDGRGNGRFEAIAGTPLHYRDGDQLRTIDMRPRRVETAALDGWRITAAGWHFAIGKPGDQSADGWIGYGADRGRHWLRFRLAGVGYSDGREYTQLAAASYDRALLSRQSDAIDLADGQDRIYAGSMATWLDIMPGVDLRWRLDGRQLKEEIVIDESVRATLLDEDPAAWLAFAFELDASGIPAWRQGDKPKTPDRGFDDKDHRIQLRDAAGALIAFMPIDFAYAALDPDGARVRLRKRIFRNNGRHWLLVGARVGDLAALPAGDLILDPSLVVQPTEAASKDTYVQLTDPTVNYGNRNSININAAGGVERRALIEFDLSSITGGSDCNSATLALTTFHTSVNATTINAYSLAAAVESWEELQATWNLYKTGNNWPGSGGGSTSGTDYEAGNIGTTTTPGAINTAFNITLTAARVAGWFGSPNTNYGLILESGSSQCAFYSSNWSTASYRPKLTIDYTLPAVDPADAAIDVTADAVATLGSTSAQVSPADADYSAGAVTVTQGTIPPTMLRYDGNAYIETTGPKISAILLATAGAKWRLLESGGSVEAIGLSVERYKGYLTPQ